MASSSSSMKKFAWLCFEFILVDRSSIGINFIFLNINNLYFILKNLILIYKFKYIYFL
jgi:hypothetical protein